MLTHPTHSRLVTLGLTGMAKAPTSCSPLCRCPHALLVVAGHRSYPLHAA